VTEEQTLYQGAEAKIVKSTYLGHYIVEKRRLKKHYRISEIDSRLITFRTKEEVKLMTQARKQGVSIPIIYDVDVMHGIIRMEYINGHRIKDVYNTVHEDERLRICEIIGQNIARLHKGDIIHGDITTSNMILFQDRIYFIDFGLGEINPDIEAKGVDLHVLMEAMESTHSKYSSEFEHILNSYKEGYGDDAMLVENKIKEIVKRGRYR
jgi:Kae1-associated kinase Bud32